MDATTPKENILKRIRDALVAVPVGVPTTVDLESSVYPEPEGDMVVVFAENFVAGVGNLIYCEDAAKTLDSLQGLIASNHWEGQLYCGDGDVQALLDAACVEYVCKPVDAVLKKVGCSACRALVAGGGSIVFDSRPGGRKMFAQAETLLFFATVDQVVPDLHTAMKTIRKNPGASMVSIWTGLSRFRDIDGISIPAWGPEKVYLFLIDDIP